MDFLPPKKIAFSCILVIFQIHLTFAQLRTLLLLRNPIYVLAHIVMKHKEVKEDMS